MLVCMSDHASPERSKQQSLLGTRLSIDHGNDEIYHCCHNENLRQQSRFGETCAQGQDRSLQQQVAVASTHSATCRSRRAALKSTSEYVLESYW